MRTSQRPPAARASSQLATRRPASRSAAARWETARTGLHTWCLEYTARFFPEDRDADDGSHPGEFREDRQRKPDGDRGLWAPWCGPCKGFAPVYEQASEAHPEVVFAKVNTESSRSWLAPSVFARSHAHGVPRQGHPVSAAGALPRTALDQVITQAKSLRHNKVQDEIRTQNNESKKAEARE